MSKLPTIKIRNKRNGKIRIINEADWAYDLGKGKYNGWERAGGETHAGDNDDIVEVAAREALARNRAEAEAREAADAEIEELLDDEAADVDTTEASDDEEASNLFGDD